ncbi:transport protein trapp [Anaeramoeba ignava]|uniref:Transport protein trapp n=1 Tax=Anaeramoeba ignava TaxID=1746090 RepID=A0A9Q0LQA3_ANAIG|nr:transport protein trapp [Anaeramoeba ignava]
MSILNPPFESPLPFETFKSWIFQQFCPLIMITISEDAEKICSTNNLSFVDLIRPFSTKNVSIQIPQSSGVPEVVTLDNFSVRLLDIDQIKPPNDSLLKEELNSIISEYFQNGKVESYFDSFCVDDLHSFLEKNPNPTPWFQKYRGHLLRSLRCSPFESIDHPVACISVISSNIPDPSLTLGKFLEQFDPSKPPQFMRENDINSDILRYYVVLHDIANSDERKGMEMFQKLEKIVGSEHCFFLKINSIADNEINQKMQDIWSKNFIPFTTKQLAENSFGKRLNANDLTSISNFMDSFLTKALIPFLEKKIDIISKEFAQSKKGFKKKFKKLISKKPKDKQTKTTRFEKGSMELKKRLIADYLFFLRRFDQAEHYYNSASKSFKQQNAVFFYASTNEMIFLSHFLQNKKFKEQNMKIAFGLYKQEQRQDLLCRAYWLAADCYKIGTNKLEQCAEKYLELTNLTENLYSALAAEQAAYCYLKNSPVWFRKYLFGLVFAGEIYAKSSCPHYAIRCFYRALSPIKTALWRPVSDFIIFSISQQSLALHQYEQAINFLKNLLGYSIQSPQNQQKNLNMFVQAFKTLHQDSLVQMDDLSLPIVDDECVEIFLTDDNIPSIRNEYPTLKDWERMAREVADFVNTKKKKEIQKKQIEKEQNSKEGISPQNTQSNIYAGFFNAQEMISKWNLDDENENVKQKVSVVGEPIKITFTLINPMKITIMFQNIHLVGKFEESENQPEKQIEIQTISTPKKMENQVMIENNKIICEKVDILFAPNETRKLSLNIIPLRTGPLHICGVETTLQDTIVSFIKFKPPKQKVLFSRKRRAVQNIPENNPLDILITRQMPLLTSDVTTIPTTSLQGCHTTTYIQLTNIGDVALNNLYVKIDEPSFFIFGESESNTQDSNENSNEKKYKMKLKNQFKNHVKNQFVSNQNNKSIIELDSSIEPQTSPDYSIIKLYPKPIRPGETVKFPLAFCAKTTGMKQFSFCFYYESEEANPEMEYRVHCALKHARVIETLKVNSFVKFSPKDRNHNILVLNIENVQKESTFKINQISSLSSSFQIEPLNFEEIKTSSEDSSAKDPPFVILKPFQSTTIFLQIFSISKSEKNKLSLIEYKKILEKSELAKNNNDENMPEFLSKSFVHRNIQLNSESLPAKISHFENFPIFLFFQRERFFHLMETSPHFHSRNFFDPQELNLVILWQTKEKNFGQHNICTLQTIPKQNDFINFSLPDKFMQIGFQNNFIRPIKLQIDAPRNANNDFKQNPVLSIPVKITIRNSSSFDFEVVLKTFAKNQPNNYHQFPSEKDPFFIGNSTQKIVPYFFWEGFTSKIFPRLKAESEISFNLNACFLKPGQFELHRFLIQATPLISSNPKNDSQNKIDFLNNSKNEKIQKDQEVVKNQFQTLEFTDVFEHFIQITNSKL